MILSVAANNMFGGNKPTFGSTSGSLFGQQNKPAGSVFGSPAATTGTSLFGQKSTTSLFGSQQPQATTSIFGSPQQANANTGSSLFGAKPSLFGTSTTPQQTNAFGGSSGGLFGSNASASGGGMFGTSSTNQQTGTTVKFNPLIGTDSMMKNGSVVNIQTKSFCISAMKEYESKSLEELRIEDYMANRKAPIAGSTGGMFGSTTQSTAQTGSLFGGSTQQQTSLFGSPAGGTQTQQTNLFGGAATTGTSLFGASNTQQQSTSLFGSKPAATTGGLFGNPAVSASPFASTTTGTSLFGNTQTTFGAAQPQQTNLFGSTPTATFGQTTQQAQPSGGLFGTPAAQPAAAGGSLFGNTSANTSGGLFGKPAAANTGFGFGTTPASTFGQPAATTGGGLFGNTAKPGGLFGSTPAPATGGLFGSQPAQPGGLFGAQQPLQQQTGFFGAQQQAPTSIAVQNPTSVAIASAPIVLGSDVNETQFKMALIDAQLAACPYGDSPLLRLIPAHKDTDDKPDPTSAARQMRFLASKNSSAVASLNGSSAASPLNQSNAVTKTSFLSNNFPVAGAKIRTPCVPTGKDLNYTSSFNPPTLGRGLRGTPTINNSANRSNMSITADVDSALNVALSGNGTQLRSSARKTNLKHLDMSVVSRALTPHSRERDPDELPPVQNDEETNVYSPAMDPRAAAMQRGMARNQEPPRLNLDTTANSDVNVSHQENVIPLNPSPPHRSLPAPAGVTLDSPDGDYYCEPTIAAMANLIANGVVVLPNGLTIGRSTYGSVFWPGRIELSNIALAEVVVFRHKEVTVYPDESQKPPLGEGLNRPAEVTLERVWHVDKETKQEIRDPLLLAEIGWRDRLERVTAKMGATFKDYRPALGSWVFRVNHFSKYGLPDDDDDGVAAGQQLARNPVLVQRQLQSQVQRARLDMSHEMDDDQMMVETENVHPDNELDVSSIAVAKNCRKQFVRGLGGMQSRFDINSLNNDDEISERNTPDQQVPPEKKIKLEAFEELYRESNRLMDALLVHPSNVVTRPAPACRKPIRTFDGGLKACETKGTGQSSLIDAACMRGRTARVGFSAGGRYVFSMQPYANSVYVKSLDWASDNDYEYISDMLEHNIRLSQRIRRNMSTSAKIRHCELEGQLVAPRLKPIEYAQLIDSFLATAKQSNNSDDERVWKLCKALFPESQEDRWRYERTEAVCTWLREEVAMENPPKATNERGSLVWSAMCRGDLDAAIDAAITDGLTNVAGLLALFQVDPSLTRRDFADQISQWETDVSSLGHLDKAILKIYLAIAGRQSIERVVKGKKQLVDCIEGLDWKQAVGVYMWWLRGDLCMEEIIEDMLHKIPTALAANDVFISQLIVLACDRAHPVENVLDAATDICLSPLDSHLSWHLWSVLRSFGYSTMCPAGEQRLHAAYAQQLTANGHAALALFVLSHISNDQTRSHAMRECLERVAPFSSAADYERMNRLLELPKQWIASAKFISAKVNGGASSFRLCELALASGDLSTAHHLLITDAAPNAVMVGEYDLLAGLMAKFEPFADRIPGWGLLGQLYADYAELKMMHDQEMDDRLNELVESLESRLMAAIACSTHIQKLSISTISSEVFTLQQLMGRPYTEMPAVDVRTLKKSIQRRLR